MATVKHGMNSLKTACHSSLKETVCVHAVRADTLVAAVLALIEQGDV